MSEMWIILWSSGGGVYPCVILSRCFWQHTSEIHSEWVLITAGLRFPPSVCPPAIAESSSPRQHKQQAVNTMCLSPVFFFFGFGKMKSVRATKTPGYVTTTRTNTRRWVQRDGREEDWHRRALCGGFTEMGVHGADNRVRSHPPNHSALHPHKILSWHIIFTILHHHQDRMHYPTQSLGFGDWRHRA